MHERSSERIEFISADAAGNEPFFDLSTTGVCCHCRKNFAQDAVVSLKINELTLKAKVVYSQQRTDGYRLGLQFVNVTAEQQKTLNDCVDKFSRGVMVTCGIVDKA